MIILDNTALSALAHIDRLDIPSKLFGDAHIPECVYYEGVLKAKKSKRVDRIKKCIESGQIKVINLLKRILSMQTAYRQLWGLENNMQLQLAYLKIV